MKYEYQIKENEFIKLKFFLLYRKPLVIVTILIFVALLFLILRDFFVFNIIDSFDMLILFLSIYLLIISPIIYFFLFRKEYRTNKPLQKRVVSEITEDKIVDTTEDSKAEASWENVHRIEELKSWFLFYYSNAMFGLSPKKSMESGQIAELRNIIRKKKSGLN